MASRTQTRRPSRARRVKSPPPSSTHWPTIEWFFESGGGEISLGRIDHVPELRHTVVASDQHTMLVALVRNPNETLHQLLDRLETALGSAIDDQVFIDEINGPSPPPPKSRRR